MTKRPYLTVGEVNRAAQTIQRLAWRGAGRKGKSPPWHELAHEQRNACREVARWHLRKLETKKDARLRNAVTKLMDIIEGVRNFRWHYDGRRLVDTKEWCEVYCAWCAIKHRQTAKRRR